MIPWIDTHTHFDMHDGNPEEALQEAISQGVIKFVNIATNPEDNETVYNFAKAHYPTVFCALGIHPHEAKLYNDDVEEYLRKRTQEKEVIAIGEIGLDYHYMHSSKEEQRSAFRRQLKLAQDLNLPVEIHTRDADEETIKILKEFQGKVRGLIHCFTGTKYLADESLKLGFNISISGIVTFKKATEIQDIVRELPLDRIHIETDAPFLAPVPLRGKKNKTAYVIHVAEFVAKLKGVTLEELSKQLLLNTKKLFPKFVE